MRSHEISQGRNQSSGQNLLTTSPHLNPAHAVSLASQTKAKIFCFRFWNATVSHRIKLDKNARERNYLTNLDNLNMFNDFFFFQLLTLSTFVVFIVLAIAHPYGPYSAFTGDFG